MIRSAFYVQIVCAIIMIINVVITGANDFHHLWEFSKFSGGVFIGTFAFEIIIEIIALIKRK